MSNLNKIIIASMLTLPLFITACVVHDDRITVENRPENELSDSAITTKIEAIFLADKNVGVLDVHVETINGAVYLTGEAPTIAVRNRAIFLAKNVRGVKSVKSSIQIVPDYE